IARIDDVRKLRRLRFFEERAMPGRIAGPPDAGDQHPDDGHTPSSAVIRHDPINAARISRWRGWSARLYSSGFQYGSTSGAVRTSRYSGEWKPKPRAST